MMPMEERNRTFPLDKWKAAFWKNTILSVVQLAIV